MGMGGVEGAAVDEGSEGGAERTRVRQHDPGPVVPGDINNHEIELLSTANLFLHGYRICVDITSLDVPKPTLE